MTDPSPAPRIPRPKVGRKKANDPFTQTEAHFIAQLNESRGLSPAALYLKFIEANPTLAQGMSSSHFRKFICLDGERRRLMPYMRAAFAKAYDVTFGSFTAYLKTGNPLDLRPSNNAPVINLDLPSIGASSRDGCVYGTLAACSPMLRMVTPEQRSAHFEGCENLLKSRGHDIFLRSAIFWDILIAGSAPAVLASFKGLAAYLAEPAAAPKAGVVDRSEWDSVLAKLQAKEEIDWTTVLFYTQDTLTRSYFLQALKSAGKDDAVVRAVATAGQASQLPLALQVVMQLGRDTNSLGWEEIAISQIYGWQDRNHSSPLAQLALLWLCGRRAGPREELERTVTRVSKWLQDNPASDSALVRWGLMWIAGMAGFDVESVLDATGAWLDAPARKTDRLVTIAYLWLAGSRGSAKQIGRAFALIQKWRARRFIPDDGCLSVAALVWLASRAFQRGLIPKAKFQSELAHFQSWTKLQPSASAFAPVLQLTKLMLVP